MFLGLNETDRQVAAARHGQLRAETANRRAHVQAFTPATTGDHEPRATAGIRDMGLGRKLVGIVVLAAALAYGPLAMAAPGDGPDTAASAGCGANAAPAAATGSAAVEWSSSPGMPGMPY